MPTNSAAWLIAPKVKPLEVKPAPYTSPRKNEIVIKNVSSAHQYRDVIHETRSRVLFGISYCPIIPRHSKTCLEGKLTGQLP